MSDRRHQRDGRSNWNKEFQARALSVFGKWEFYKRNLTTGKVVSISEGRAVLEINTANIDWREMSTRCFSNLGEFDIAQTLKDGAKIYTTDFEFEAIHSRLTAKAA